MKRRGIMTFLIFISMYILINFYIGWHGWYFLTDRFAAARSYSLLFWIPFWILAFSFIFSEMGLRKYNRSVFVVSKWVGSYWLVIVLYCIFLLPFADALIWVSGVLAFNTPKIAAYLGFGVLAVLIFILMKGSWNAWNPIVRKYQISVNKSAGTLREMKIAVASDLHLGRTVRKRYLRVLVERLNLLQPDLILLPGDVLDNAFTPFVNQGMGEVMRQMRATYGVYAVLGNHEYYGGQIQEYVNEMKDCGIPVLQDQSVLIQDLFYVVGRKDKAAESMDPSGRKPISELVEGLDHAKPIIMMDHQPYALKQASEAGVDMLFCGHTHRGQMYPNHLITRKIFELDWGYLLKGSLHAFVSSGFGTWGPPIRLGSRSEIILVTVKYG